jgi:TIR domain/Tetratricopeptide repeat
VADDLGSETSAEPHFYISYAGPDRLWAEWAGFQLERAGYSVVLDLWHVLPGDNIVLAREDALRRAGQVLALCSAAYFGGGFTEQDWTTAMATQHDKPRRLVPVWIENLDETQLPGMLRSLQPIKVFDVPEAEARRRLLDGLAGDLGPKDTPAFPGPPVPAERDQDAGSSPRMPGPGRPGTWHVPPRNTGFTGRDSTLVAIREMLMRSSPQTAVVLQGPGGVGKTQLSVEYAHRFASDYDTVWVFDAEQPELIAGQFAELAGVMGVSRDGSDAQLAASAALAALRGRERWLLVFDNVEDPDQLTDFFPDGSGHILATSRVGGWQEIGSLVPVEEFSRAESVAMLTASVAALPAAEADAVAEALGDFPLALAQAVGTLQLGLPAAEFRQMLDEHATKILSESKPRSYRATQAAATLLAMDKLTASDPKAAGLLCLCSYLAPESVPATWFRELGRPDLPAGTWEASQAFGRIRDIGLGRVDQKGLRLHRLTQAILRDYTAADQAAYRDGAIAILAAAAPPGSDDPAYWPDWSSLIPHLMLVDPQRAPDAFRPLACAGVRYLLVSGQAKAALTLTRRLYETWSAELGPDNSDTLTVAQHLVHAIHDNGEYVKALEFQHEVFARRSRVLGEDHPDTLRSASDLAVTLYSAGRSRDALPLNEDTCDRCRRVLGEDYPDTLTSASNLAGTLNRLGRRAEALTLHQDTYDRCRRVLGEDHPHTLTSASNLAGTLNDLGRRAEALTLHQDTYDRCRRVLGESHPDTLTSAENLANNLMGLGRRSAALRVMGSQPKAGKRKKR